MGLKKPSYATHRYLHVAIKAWGGAWLTFQALHVTTHQNNEYLRPQIVASLHVLVQIHQKKSLCNRDDE